MHTIHTYTYTSAHTQTSNLKEAVHVVYHVEMPSKGKLLDSSRGKIKWA